MKLLCFIVVLLCVRVGKSQYFKLYNDGTYDFNYHTSGGQHRSEVRYADGTILGKYAYITPLGQRIDVEYSAGRHGYKEKRKVSKLGIKKKGSPRLNIQTKPSFGSGSAPFSASNSQFQLESPVKKFPVFRPHFEDNHASFSNSNNNVLKLQRFDPQFVYRHQSPPPTTQRTRYPTEDDDFDFNPSTQSNFQNFIHTTTHKPKVIWIPSVYNRPRMPQTPIWIKPTEDYHKAFRALTTSSTTPPTTTTENPIPKDIGKALIDSGLILRQPLRRPVLPIVISHEMNVTTTAKPLETTTKKPENESACFKTLSPLKDNSKVTVNPVGNSGVVNVKPLDAITSRILREDGLRAVMSPKENGRIQFLPLNGFSFIPHRNLDRNNANKQNNANNQLGVNIDPSQHIVSSAIEIRDRPNSQQEKSQSNGGTDPFPPNFTPDGPVNRNFYNFKFQGMGNFQAPDHPLDFITTGFIQPRRD